MTDQRIVTDGGVDEENDDEVPLSSSWVENNIGVSGLQADAIFKQFPTLEQLTSALAAGEDLESRKGIGPKTASAIWDWYHNVYEGEIQPDDTLVLDDEGLHLPDWLVGYVGQLMVYTPTITMQASTTDKGLGETSSLLKTYPQSGDYNIGLEAGMIKIAAAGREEVYEIDDCRTEAEVTA